MAKIKIIWVGKTKERYLAEGINHYLKLLTPMAQVSVVEIREEKGKQKEAAMVAEAGKIFRQTRDYFLLDEKGDEFTSVALAGFLKNIDSVDFVIGGPFGVAAEVKDKAKGSMALSKMTLTHEMARLLFLEQLYRAFAILKGKEYHH
ncbi:MAG TPA: 23S rRNA (pseudouridine(1915)-N(3))-methyltransferase RlmH [Dissulfurispiraceae bacterium]|nr:23S rRNA (pseudouridine(1915)-N(3))-methyltransferase RlmH [Dissulfurispiraceae bacterium]